METDVTAQPVEPDETPEASDDHQKTAEPIPVMEFEGEYVRVMEGKLPAITLEMSEGYARGTHLKLLIEVRVRSFSFPEDRKTKELIRSHNFALEEVQLLGAYTPEEVDPGVGGSASAAAQDPDDEPDPGGVGF